MKPKECTQEIAFLVEKIGTRREVANRLNITERYIYELQNGEIPGRFLYLFISEVVKSYKKQETLSG